MFVKKAISVFLVFAIVMSLSVISGAASAKDAGVLTVLDTIYDSLAQGNAGLFPAKKSGLWGVINTAGETVIPFAYDQILTPDDNGYVAAYKGVSQAAWWQTEEAKKTCYLFDKTGKTVWQSSKDLLFSCTEGIMQIRSNFAIGAHYGPYDDDNFTVTYQKVDGTQIAEIKGVQYAGSFSEGHALLDNQILYANGVVARIRESFSPWVASFNYSNGKGSQVIGVSGGCYMAYQPLSDFCNLYNISNEEIGEGYIGGIWGSDNEKGICISNVGTLAVAWNGSSRTSEFNTNFPEPNNLCYLIDFTKYETVHVSNEYGEYDRTQLVPLSKKGYKSIQLNLNENWFFVQSVDGKWGYLSRDGETEVFDFDTDASEFQGGYALVTHKGETFVIDGGLNKVSNLITGFVGGYTVGSGVYAIADEYGDYRMAVYDETPAVLAEITLTEPIHRATVTGTLYSDTVFILDYSFEEEEVASIDALLKSTYMDYAFFNLNLFRDGIKIQPDNKVTMAIPLAASWDPKAVEIYHIASNGTKTLMDTIYDKGMFVFETNLWGTYAIGTTYWNVWPIENTKMSIDRETLCITGVSESTTFEAFCAMLENDASNIVLKDKNGNEIKTGELVGTGATLSSLDAAGKPAGDVFTVVVQGDLDGDGKVNVPDARKALRAAVKLDTISDFQSLAADVDGSGKVEVPDARLILRVAVGLQGF